MNRCQDTPSKYDSKQEAFANKNVKPSLQILVISQDYIMNAC